MTDEVQKPPLKRIQFQGRIHLITTDQQLAVIAKDLMAATELGFDTETRPSFRKGEVYQTSLLQLATDQEAYLIRLRGLTEFRGLIEVFESKEILKVGVAIRDDLKKLQHLFRFSQQNFVELQDVAKMKGLKNFGLKGMTEEVLTAGLSKRAKITNWDAHRLTDDQLMYAATDAWVGLQLFRALKSWQRLP